MKSTALRLFLIVAAVLLTGCRSSTDGVELAVRPFRQCNAAWGAATMGTGGETICETGALLTSLAMMLSTDDDAVTPATLNAYLNANGGYVGGSAIILCAAVNGYPGTPYSYVETVATFSLSRLKQELDLGNPVPVRVNSGTHYFLVFSYEDGGAAHEDFRYYDPAAGSELPQTLGSADDPDQLLVYHR